jgi:hypothetical protein
MSSRTRPLRIRRAVRRVATPKHTLRPLLQHDNVQLHRDLTFVSSMTPRRHSNCLNRHATTRCRDARKMDKTRLPTLSTIWRIVKVRSSSLQNVIRRWRPGWMRSFGEDHRRTRIGLFRQRTQNAWPTTKVNCAARAQSKRRPAASGLRTLRHQRPSDLYQRALPCPDFWFTRQIN